jgi:hypothetical protein
MNKKWQVNSSVLSTTIDQEAVLMSIEQESYFGLDSIGTRIWELLSLKSATIDELTSILMEEYDVDENTCRSDVKAFIDDMSERKLIISVS